MESHAIRPNVCEFVCFSSCFCLTGEHTSATASLFYSPHQVTDRKLFVMNQVDTA